MLIKEISNIISLGTLDIKQRRALRNMFPFVINVINLQFQSLAKEQLFSIIKLDEVPQNYSV